MILCWHSFLTCYVKICGERLDKLEKRNIDIGCADMLFKLKRYFSDKKYQHKSQAYDQDRFRPRL